MTKKEIKNYGKSVRTRLLTVSKESGIPYMTVLVRYFQERLLGDIRPLPDAARKAVLEAVDDTADNTGLVFNIAINYGGRAEIVRAAKQLAQQAAEGQLDPENITEDLFTEQLYTADLPDPDLIIRTGGELRLSNFLTWQSAYSEIYVTDTYWPDFTPEKLTEAIESFNGRDRRFGGIKA